MKPCPNIAKPKSMNTSCNCSLKIPSAMTMWIWSSLPTQWHQRPMVTWACCPPENSCLKQTWFIQKHINSMIQFSLRTTNYQTTFPVGPFPHTHCASLVTGQQKIGDVKGEQSRQEKSVSQISCSWFWCSKLFEASDLKQTVLQTGQRVCLSTKASVDLVACLSLGIRGLLSQTFHT